MKKKQILKDFYRKDQQVALKSKSGTYDPIVLDKKMTNILRNCLRFKKRKKRKEKRIIIYLPLITRMT